MGCMNSKAGTASSGTVVVGSNIPQATKVREWLDSDADVSNNLELKAPIETDKLEPKVEEHSMSLSEESDDQQA